ncbi:enolase C-terminal domain-like protein [Hydrogenophaga sp. OTU3427]|jgi:mandelate racemase|uniref:enolase C-terminal domain-like protein n=1 Tax=Hydrogenophaga sp. OTU3427 TaxID=3043856 RepID=UPI00313CBBA1
MDITITDVTARSVNVPLEFPVRTSVGIVATAPLVLIDLSTSSGVVGRSYLFTYTPAALEATRQMVLSLGKLIEGKPLAPFDLDTLFSQRLRLLGKTGIALMACSGLDMAVWDALAVSQELPLAKLLGGTIRPIKAYDSHSMDGVELGVKRAQQSRSEGFTAIKTKIGYATLAEDIKVVRALREVIGPDTQLLVDYNQGLTVPEAIRRINVLKDEGIAWVEEPTLQEDYTGHAKVRDSVSLPIQMGENWCGPDEMHKALMAGACDLAMPDVMKMGGVTGWIRASALAHAHGIPMSSHIFQEISVHLLAVTPTCHFLERMDLAAPILREPLKFVNGSATPPDIPGVGIHWNEDAVSRLAA